MIVNYDKDNGLSTIFNGFEKKIPNISDEAKKVLNDIQESIDNGFEFDFSSGFVGEMEIADKSLLAFLNDTKYAEKTLSNYKKYLESVGNGTSKFSSSLKNLGGTLLSTFANMAIMYAAGAAIQFVGTKIYEYIKATEIAIEAGEKAQNAIKEVYDTYNSKVSTVTDLGKQLASDTASIKTTSDAVEALT